MAGNEHTEATLITKPTIAELEAILEEKDVRIEILPNGEVRVDSSDELNTLKARLLEAEHEVRLAHAELDSTRLRLTHMEGQLADANKRAQDLQKNVEDLSKIVFNRST